MRKILVLLLLVLLLGGFNTEVLRKERLLADGPDILLRLAPVDPRALLLGDYMTLEYSINNEIRSALRARYGGARGRSGSRWPASGLAVIRIAGESSGDIPGGAASFVRLDDGSALASDEARLAFHVRGGAVITASTAYYFQEGKGKRYESAVYGRLRLDGDGKTLLVALCDASGNDIRPGDDVQPR